MIMDFLFVLIAVIAVALVAFIIYSILKSPFKYPYYKIKFDVSRKRSPNIDDLIDRHLIENTLNEFTKHYEKVVQWKATCQSIIDKSKLKKLRMKQFESIIDDEHMFCFELIRKQTRYKQVNYVRTPYCVNISISKHSFSFEYIKYKFNALKKINFECTLSEYHSKEQRKRVTKALREEIASRDNYTCRHCGKYMPDGVGLRLLKEEKACRQICKFYALNAMEENLVIDKHMPLILCAIKKNHTLQVCFLLG